MYKTSCFNEKKSKSCLEMIKNNENYPVLLVNDTKPIQNELTIDCMKRNE